MNDNWIKIKSLASKPYNKSIYSLNHRNVCHRPIYNYCWYQIYYYHVIIYQSCNLHGNICVLKLTEIYIKLNASKKKHFSTNPFLARASNAHSHKKYQAESVKPEWHQIVNQTKSPMFEAMQRAIIILLYFTAQSKRLNNL